MTGAGMARRHLRQKSRRPTQVSLTDVSCSIRCMVNERCAAIGRIQLRRADQKKNLMGQEWGQGPASVARVGRALGQVVRVEHPGLSGTLRFQALLLRRLCVHSHHRPDALSKRHTRECLLSQSPKLEGCMRDSKLGQSYH